MADFGAVDKLASGKWRARYTDPATGRRHSAPYTFERKGEASAWLAKKRTELATGLSLDEKAAKRCLSTFWEPYLLTVQATKKPNTIRDYSYIWSNQVGPRFGSVPVSRIRPGDIDAWAAGLTAAGLSAQKVRNAVGLLSRLLDRAVRDGALSGNPVERRADKLPAVPQANRPVLSPVEVEALGQAFKDPDDRTLVLVMAYAGLRIGEALALQRRDVDLVAGLIHVSRSVDANTLALGLPKNGKTRSVTVPSRLVDELKAVLSHVPINPDAWLFPNSRGGVRRYHTFMRDRWRPAAQRWDEGRTDAQGRLVDPLGVTPHDLRSTCASLLIDSGASPKDVQAHLGHARVETTLALYARIRPGRSESLAIHLNALLDEALEG